MYRKLNGMRTFNMDNAPHLSRCYRSGLGSTDTTSTAYAEHLSASSPFRLFDTTQQDAGPQV